MQTRRLHRFAKLGIFGLETRDLRVVISRFGVIQPRFAVALVAGKSERLGVRSAFVADQSPRVVLRAHADRACARDLCHGRLQRIVQEVVRIAASYLGQLPIARVVVARDQVV